MALDYIPAIEYTPPGGSLTTITFVYPPVGLDAEKMRLRAVQRVSTSASGVQQTSHSYNEKVLNPTLSHITSALKDSVETFLTTHAMLGREFDYYVHGTDEAGSKETVTLSREGRIIRFDKMAIADLYRFTLRMRKAVV